MALYALNFEQLISADEAPNQGKYCCIECKKPLQVRQGRRRRHFYHIKKSPSCRLYSKSEDHLLLQLQIQSIFLKGDIILERPFLSIGRIADVCWDKHKIIFEIQCSLITQKEVEERIADYLSLGYTVVWLLDDRLFNRRHLQPAEAFLRQTICYYIRYQRNDLSLFYDQFEIFQENIRLQKGSKSSICLYRPRHMTQTPSGRIPQQILFRSTTWRLFFQGDLFYKALISKKVPSLAVSMENWAFWEEHTPLQKNDRGAKVSWGMQLFYRFLEWLLQKVNT